MTRVERVTAAIVAGDLPYFLVGEDSTRYRGVTHAPTWEGWCSAWFGITYVRAQAFERWYDAADETDAWEPEPVAMSPRFEGPAC